MAEQYVEVYTALSAAGRGECDDDKTESESLPEPR
jgi:hypothetical protein